MAALSGGVPRLCVPEKYLGIHVRGTVKRARIKFAGREVEFVDRDVAVGQLGELAERGTWVVHIIYGPEGCGKTALLMQARAILEDRGYHVVYVNPLAREVGEMLQYSSPLKRAVKEAFKLFPEPYSRIVDVAINIVGEAMRRLRRPRLAVLMDDIFQAIGTDRAEQYVKALLNLIEWPPADYDKIIVLVASSEGVTRERVGRHRWATIRIMWNMARDGFQQLYEQLPGPKPPPEEAWRLTGGNPEMLEGLFRAEWNMDVVVDGIVGERGVAALAKRWSNVLWRVVEDPDHLWDWYPDTEPLIRGLVQANLIVEVWDRKPHLWVDVPPPERDVELGIGRYYAWQTPLHREAVRRALR